MDDLERDALAEMLERLKNDRYANRQANKDVIDFEMKQWQYHETSAAFDKAIAEVQAKLNPPETAAPAPTVEELRKAGAVVLEHGMKIPPTLEQKADLEQRLALARRSLPYKLADARRYAVEEVAKTFGVPVDSLVDRSSL